MIFNEALLKKKGLKKSVKVIKGRDTEIWQVGSSCLYLINIGSLISIYFKDQFIKCIKTEKGLDKCIEFLKAE